MTIYRIWEKGYVISCGFCENFDDPTAMIYSSEEIAQSHLPKNRYGKEVSTEYYIKREEIE